MFAWQAPYGQTEPSPQPLAPPLLSPTPPPPHTDILTKQQKATRKYLTLEMPLLNTSNLQKIVQRDN